MSLKKALDINTQAGRDFLQQNLGDDVNWKWVLPTDKGGKGGVGEEDDYVDLAKGLKSLIMDQGLFSSEMKEGYQDLSETDVDYIIKDIVQAKYDKAIETEHAQHKVDLGRALDRAGVSWGEVEGLHVKAKVAQMSRDERVHYEAREKLRGMQAEGSGASQAEIDEQVEIVDKAFETYQGFFNKKEQQIDIRTGASVSPEAAKELGAYAVDVSDGAEQEEFINDKLKANEDPELTYEDKLKNVFNRNARNLWLSDRQGEETFKVVINDPVAYKRLLVSGNKPVGETKNGWVFDVKKIDLAVSYTDIVKSDGSSLQESLSGTSFAGQDKVFDSPRGYFGLLEKDEEQEFGRLERAKDFIFGQDEFADDDKSKAFKRSLKDYRDDRRDYLSRDRVLTRMYLHNEDVTTGSDIVDVVEQGATLLYEGFGGILGRDIRADESMWHDDGSGRRQKDILETIVNSTELDATEIQKEEFSRSGAYKTFEGVTGFVPAIAEFAVLDVAIKKIGAVTGIPGLIANIGKTYKNAKGVRYTKPQLAKIAKGSKKSATPANRGKVTIGSPAFERRILDQGGEAVTSNTSWLLGHTYGVFKEEVKMQAAFDEHYHMGGGAGFYAVGAMLPSWTTKYNQLNQLIKVGKSGTAGMISTQVAKVFEAAVRDASGDETLTTFVNENYTSLSDLGQEAVIDFAVFAIVGGKGFITDAVKGVQGRGGSSFRTTEKLDKLETELGVKIIPELKKKLASDPENKELQEELEKYKELFTDVSNTLNGIDKVADWTDPAKAQKMVERAGRNFTNTFKALGVDVQFEATRDRSKFDGNEAATWNPKTGKILIDTSMVEAGKMPHEVFHVAMMHLFKSNPVVLNKFKAAIEENFKDVKYGGVQVKDASGKPTGEVKEMGLEEMIKNEYGERANFDKISANEYLAYVSEALANPKFYRQHVGAGTWKNLKNDLNRFTQRHMGATVFENGTKQDIVDFMANFAVSVREGNLTRKQVNAFKKVKVGGVFAEDIHADNRISDLTVEETMASKNLEALKDPNKSAEQFVENKEAVNKGEPRLQYEVDKHVFETYKEGGVTKARRKYETTARFQRSEDFANFFMEMSKDGGLFDATIRNEGLKKGVNENEIGKYVEAVKDNLIVRANNFKIEEAGGSLFGYFKNTAIPFEGTRVREKFVKELESGERGAKLELDREVKEGSSKIEIEAEKSYFEKDFENQDLSMGAKERYLSDLRESGLSEAEAESYMPTGKGINVAKNLKFEAPKVDLQETSLAEMLEIKADPKKSVSYKNLRKAVNDQVSDPIAIDYFGLKPALWDIMKTTPSKNLNNPARESIQKVLKKNIETHLKLLPKGVQDLINQEGENITPEFLKNKSTGTKKVLLQIPMLYTKTSRSGKNLPEYIKTPEFIKYEKIGTVKETSPEYEFKKSFEERALAEFGIGENAFKGRNLDQRLKAIVSETIAAAHNQSVTTAINSNPRLKNLEGYKQLVNQISAGKSGALASKKDIKILGKFAEKLGEYDYSKQPFPGFYARNEIENDPELKRVFEKHGGVEKYLKDSTFKLSDVNLKVFQEYSEASRNLELVETKALFVPEIFEAGYSGTKARRGVDQAIVDLVKSVKGGGKLAKLLNVTEKFSTKLKDKVFSEEHYGEDGVMEEFLNTLDPALLKGLKQMLGATVGAGQYSPGYRELVNYASTKELKKLSNQELLKLADAMKDPGVYKPVQRIALEMDAAGAKYQDAWRNDLIKAIKRQLPTGDYLKSVNEALGKPIIEKGPKRLDAKWRDTMFGKLTGEKGGLPKGLNIKHVKVNDNKAFKAQRDKILEKNPDASPEQLARLLKEKLSWNKTVEGYEQTVKANELMLEYINGKIFDFIKSAKGPVAKARAINHMVHMLQSQTNLGSGVFRGLATHNAVSIKKGKTHSEHDFQLGNFTGNTIIQALKNAGNKTKFNKNSKALIQAYKQSIIEKITQEKFDAPEYGGKSGFDYLYDTASGKYMWMRELDVARTTVDLSSEKTYDQLLSGVISGNRALKKANAIKRKLLEKKGLASKDVKMSPTEVEAAMRIHDEALKKGRLKNKQRKGMSTWDFDDTLAHTKSDVIVNDPSVKQTKMYNGSPKSFSKLGGRSGVVFLASEAREAKAYADSQGGKVREIYVDNNKVGTEKQLLEKIEELGYSTEDALAYELIDTRFPNSLKQSEINRVIKALKKDGLLGINYTDGAQVVGGTTKSTMVFDKAIISEKPIGSRKISAEEFAEKGAELLEQGYEFDFSEFNKVTGGQPGPFLEKALERAKKFGTKDQFILTARAPESAPAIREFLKSQGLDIPLENIMGLGNSTPEAKAMWMVSKFSEGYNDMYFADDALPNVKAVKRVLNQLDVKSKVQQAMASMNVNLKINDIMQHSLGIESVKRFSKAEGRMRGMNAKRRKLFVPDTAADLDLLLEPLYGKGKQGIENKKWLQENFYRKFERGVNDFNTAKQRLTTEYMSLRKRNKDVVKNIPKEVPGTSFSHDQAMRVYLWDKAGFKTPDLAENTKQQLVDYVNNNPKYKAYADNVGRMTGIETGLKEPSVDWWAETIATEITDVNRGVGRQEYLADFTEARQEIFSEENLNKMESKLGKNWRDTIEDMFERMETGRSRSEKLDPVSAELMNYFNGSVGTIMNFNTRSALLQLTSSVNFVNSSFNNPARAAQAFANQPQYWKDFMKIMNSDMLKQRRNGLQINVTEAEIATAAKNSKNPARAVIARILKAGYLPTKIADSFAIASGGATYYRNAIRKYTNEGMSKTQAEKQAFLDFQAIAERTQQSSRADLISKQQTTFGGRLILPFANTPMQMNRLALKEMLDISKGRYKNAAELTDKLGKIGYYGFIQTAIFAGLQSAGFAIFANSDDDDLKAKKKTQMLETITDSSLRGMGIKGAVVNGVINAVKEFDKQKEKGYGADYSEIAEDLLSISPPVGSKFRKMDAAGNTYKYNKEQIEEEGIEFSLDSPGLQATTQVVEAVANIPANRVFKKLNNLKNVADSDYAVWERTLMALGWTNWDVNPDLAKEKAKDTKPEKKKKEKKGKAKHPKSYY